MKSSTAWGILALSALTPLPAERAAAQDASFGCKVLLCSAATSPGWSSISYCVPVMQTLFRILAKGGSWPMCPEGRASSPGYEPFEACPVGLMPVAAASDGATGLTESPNGNLCADLSKPRQSCAAEPDCATSYPTTPRAARAKPHFVDISTANGVQRFYFSLQGY